LIDATLMLLRAVVTAVDDSTGLQTVSVMTRGGKALDGVEVFRSYGFSCVPVKGAEGLLLRVGADRSHPVFICGDDRRYRPTAGQPGEVGLYSDEGDRITLKDGNLIEVVSVTKVRVIAPDVEISAANEILLDTPLVKIPGGDIEISGIKFLDHVHPENDNGGPTEKPQ